MNSTFLRFRKSRSGFISVGLVVLILIVIGIGAALTYVFWSDVVPSPINREIQYEPRKIYDTSGVAQASQWVTPWYSHASLEEISGHWNNQGFRGAEAADRKLQEVSDNDPERLQILIDKAFCLNYEGKASDAYKVLEEARRMVEEDPEGLGREWKFSVIYLQGVTAFRRAENENCVMCRGPSSCTLPIVLAAVHTNKEGSTLAIEHFGEYLARFPDDAEIRWLYNLAHMTLGLHPDGVKPEYLIELTQFMDPKYDIGQFRDISDVVGLVQFNQAGGAIMDDFDNDHALDLVASSFDPSLSLRLFRNNGEGRFDDVAKTANLKPQLGGLVCFQADYNNDGFLDIYIPRGAWLELPVRPSLIRNNGDGTFTDVTSEASLLNPVNSSAASWADYDLDGDLDLFVCCERQPSMLYINIGNGSFFEAAQVAGIKDSENSHLCKGVAWTDIDNDRYPDLFLNYFGSKPRLFRNNREGRFVEVTEEQGINGPDGAFACWTWDYDNDGWLDIFSAGFERDVGAVIEGLRGTANEPDANKLYRNNQGEGYEDQTIEAGLNLNLSPIGNNFADFDNDGALDFYTGTGGPSIATLVPNRMFKNVDGKFFDISRSTRTAHLQKGHGVACGDWDRDGSVDIFIEVGGANNGDRYHNILYQNPGQKGHSITLKLVGQGSNRSAIGARVKLVAGGKTIHRLVTSGSSFGGNPLEMTIGIGAAETIDEIEVLWPGMTEPQIWKDLKAERSVLLVESESEPKDLQHSRIDWQSQEKKK